MLDFCALTSFHQVYTFLLHAAPETFDKFVNGGKHALVEFYAPWSVFACTIVAECSSHTSCRLTHLVGVLGKQKVLRLVNDVTGVGTAST